MKTTLQIIIILCSFFVNSQNLNMQNTTLNWTGKAAYSNYELTGELRTKSGVLLIKNDSITKLSITIDMKSLDHENNDLKKHLRRKDFFEIKKYPEATFTLTKTAIIKNGKATLIGNMTIKNSSKEETITINISNDNTNTSIELNFYLDRTLYGVTFNSPTIFEKLKENAIDDKFKLSGTLKFK